jgi:hypothetical protein
MSGRFERRVDVEGFGGSDEVVGEGGSRTILPTPIKIPQSGGQEKYFTLKE